MSFQIKKTHKFLQPAQPQAPPKPTIESYLKGNEKSKDYEWMNKHTSAKQPAKPDSSQGLCIKSNIRAQEDYM